MKKLFVTLCVAVSAIATKAQEGGANPVDPNAPEIKWETTEIDYGTIKQDENGAREFKFTNVGKSPLVISNCRGSCGCTVPECPKEPIMPGKSGLIKVNYDTHRIGPFTKTVTVESNAKNNPHTLKISGTVLDPNADATSGQEVKPAQVVPVAPAVEKQAAPANEVKPAPVKDNKPTPARKGGSK
jgi:hypothetical protein